MQIGFQARWQHPPPTSRQVNHQEIQGARPKPKSQGKKQRSGGSVFFETLSYKNYAHR